MVATNNHLLSNLLPEYTLILTLWQRKYPNYMAIGFQTDVTIRINKTTDCVEVAMVAGPKGYGFNGHSDIKAVAIECL